VCRRVSGRVAAGGGDPTGDQDRQGDGAGRRSHLRGHTCQRSSGAGTRLARSRRLDARRAHLVLHDASGQTGLIRAVAQPDRFARAVLINSRNLIDRRRHLPAKLHRVPLLGYFAALTGRLAPGTILRSYQPRLSRTAVTQWRKGFGRGQRTSSVISAVTLHPSALRSMDEPGMVDELPRLPHTKVNRVAFDTDGSVRTFGNQTSPSHTPHRCAGVLRSMAKEPGAKSLTV
jgi:pimeloyl-ACP methyl ester carboxylesterase